MTAVTFPTNPSNGDTYLVNGRTYVYTSTTNTWSVPSTYSGIFNPIDSKSYVATSGQSTFSVTYTSGLVEAYVNGIKIDPVGYSATNGTSITFNTGLTAGDVVNLVGYSGSVGVTATTLSELSDVSTTSPTDRQVLAWNNSSSVWAPANTGIAIYATVNDLPLSGNNTGDQAFVLATNRLYLWNGTGWYNIALINTNPSITGGYNSSYSFATDGTPIEITLVGSDPEGIPLTWSYEVTSGSLINGGGTTATVSNVANVFTITPTTTEAYAGTFSITWKASDGVNIGTAISEFTLTFYVDFSKYTSLLTKAITGNNNSTFTDTSTNNFTVTRSGNVTQGTFTPFSRLDGEWSIYFDGNGDQFTKAADANFNFSTGDWTIEGWFYRSSLSGPSASLMTVGTGGSAIHSSFGVGGANGIVRADFGSGTWGWASQNESSTGAISINTWHHVAFVKSGTSLLMFVDGVNVHTSTPNFGSGSSGTVYLGSYFNNYNNDGSWYSGNVSNFRIVNGTALYTTNFTPDANPLTAVTNTQLLFAQDKRFKDNSANNYALTAVGNVAVKAFGPFDRRGNYDATAYGGSGYFDGTGDYLTIANNAALYFGSGDFTVETWIYPTVSGSKWIGGIWSYSDPAAQAWGLYITGGYYQFTIDPADTIINTSTTPVVLNQWTHLAVTRSGNTYRMFVNGVIDHTATLSHTMQNGTSPLYIGTTQSAPAGVQFVGYIRDFHVIKGEAKYTADFTPAQTTTTTANTSLMLNFDNINIYDQSGNNNLELVGNVSTNTSITKYGVGSMYFDGTGDWIHLQANNNLEPMGGDFTYEWWWYPTTVSQRQWFFHSATDYWIAVDFQSDGKGLGMWASSTGSSWDLINSDPGGNGISSTVPSLNTWHHIAYVRNGSTFTLYLDGTSIVSVTGITAAIVDRSSEQKVIGSWAMTNHQLPIVGYIEDFRVTKGLARYTSAFTPPTTTLVG